jgi:hypothetical protein
MRRIREAAFTRTDCTAETQSSQRKERREKQLQKQSKRGPSRARTRERTQDDEISGLVFAEIGLQIPHCVEAPMRRIREAAFARTDCTAETQGSQRKTAENIYCRNKSKRGPSLRSG